MNTPAHLIFGTAMFGKAGNARVTTAALIGSMVPDISLYAMVGWSIYIKGVPAHTVFREYYYSPQWQQVFAVDNSFVLWGVFFVLALWAKRPALIAFGGAALLHLALDFPLHNYDARMHFWPLTDWVFISPFSYWDHRHYAGVIGPIELIGAIIGCLVLCRRHCAHWARGLVGLLAGAEVMASGFFRWIF